MQSRIVRRVGLVSLLLSLAAGLVSLSVDAKEKSVRPAASKAAALAEIRLIVVGDDTGAMQGINEGTVAAHRYGILTDTNVIVPGPWFPHIVRLSQEYPNLGFGVHLALTSEWETIKWRPLTYAKTLVTADGYFPPMVWPNPGYPPGNSLKEMQPNLAEVERELRAQITLARRHIPRVSYVWQHMGLSSYSKDVQAIVRKLSEETGLPDLADILKALDVKGVGSVELPAPLKDSLKDATPVERLVARLEHLGPGTWMAGGHLAIDSPEMRAIGHAGSDGVAAERSREAAEYSDPRVKAVVARRGIKLIPVSVLAAEYLARKR